MTITLKQLQVFVCTVKYGSISKAADMCYTSQPAATMALRQLESQLKTPLFDRRGKRLILNTDGKVLLPKASAIVDQAKELEFFLHAKGHDMQGEISIGASLTIGHYLLPSLIASFKVLHPHVQLSLKVANTLEVLNECHDFSLDIGIVEGRVYSGKVDIFPWQRDELVIIARGSHPLSKKKTVSFSDLEQYPWVMREKGSGTAALIFDYAQDRFTLSTEVILTNFEAIKRYVISSDCLSCVSRTALDFTKISALRVLPVDGFELIRPLSIIRSKEKFCSRAGNCFQEYLLS